MTMAREGQPTASVWGIARVARPADHARATVVAQAVRGSAAEARSVAVGIAASAFPALRESE